ncbi:serine/threonine-protein kinase [Mycobacterium sp. 2YAF39]|uniref:serine/threonine-protein kinase n=1 Tax=Mycobacterium sp. 2YAF39 TaxID=3233033 RepID=UPI003F974ED8
MFSPGEKFEGHVVDDVLGRGGYATVYRAYDADSDREVALKVLDHHDQEYAARLRREFEFASRLTHPHIVKVYARGHGWLSMELVSGGGITNVDTVATRVAALEKIADALDYAHNRAIVHCDVKPANILVHQDLSSPVLIDFGVAHAIADDIGRRPGQIEASLPYAAPELITGHAPSGATDEYALACTVVELVTGSPPFTALSGLGLIDAHLHKPPPRRSDEISWLPRVFDSITAKALAKAPQDRYRSCREFVSLIARALH